MVHGQQMDRAKLVSQVRSERERMQRDRDNDQYARESAEKDRQLTQSEAQEPPADGGEQQPDLIAQLSALLAQRQGNKRYRFERDETGRIVGAQEIQQEGPA